MTNSGQEVKVDKQLAPEKIEERAWALLREFGFPVNEGLAERLGFTVATMRFQDPKITGLILVNDREPIKGVNVQRFIGISEDLPKDRYRFILAHELGHFILHKRNEEPLFAFRDYDNSRSGTPEEEQAELFARALLMPKEYIKTAVQSAESDIKNNRERLSEYISKLFQVTPKKADQRLEELNLYAA